MKMTLKQLKALCVKNNFFLPQGAKMSDDEEHTKEHDIFLHAILTPSKAYLIDSGASNHMVASWKSFITFPLSGGPRSHIGDDSKIQYSEIGSNKIHHDEFIPSPTEKKIVEDE